MTQVRDFFLLDPNAQFLLDSESTFLGTPDCHDESELAFWIMPVHCGAAEKTFSPSSPQSTCLLNTFAVVDFL